MSSPSQKIPVRVRLATRSDIEDLVRINDEAFSPGIISQLLYPTGMPDDAKTKMAADLAEVIDAAGTGANANHSSEPKAYENYVVVAEIVSQEEQSKPETVAFARFEVWRKPRSETEWKAAESLSSMKAEGANNELMDVFMGGVHEMRLRNMKGDPGICLRTLVCTPKRGRLGAGSALLSWGNELADRERLPIWLEASPKGYGLYRRFGFEDVDMLETDLQRWGAVRKPDENWGANCAVDRFGVAREGVYRSVGMRRPAAKG
ncbi:N-acetyltransferase-like protein [Coniochaeta sp. 2T2.1]|nr:N-acetyltransferase-like protein [Coniochaeta sp. 2T2.1]